MGTIQTLTRAGRDLEPSEWDKAAVGRPVLDPRLQLTYQPIRCREADPVDPLAELVASSKRVVDAMLAAHRGATEPAGDVDGPPDCGGAAGDALGLSDAQSPQNPPKRHGTKGLSSNGARQIQRAAAVLQDDLGKLSFWTVTLPDDTIRELVARDLWPQFQSRIRDLLVRALKARGLPPRVVGVVELHPARSMRERLPLPHLHVIFQGSRRRWHGWVLQPTDLDRIIRDAVRYVGLPAPDVRSAGNVQPVRRNCGAYLAKYMTKSRQSQWLAGVPGNLPRVWWFWSGWLRREVLALVVETTWAFASWCHRLPCDLLVSYGMVRVRLELADPRAPGTWVVRWRTAEHLSRAVASWLQMSRAACRTMNELQPGLW